MRNRRQRRQHEKIERYTADKNTEGSGDKGKRVGTAYQLENGEIIYVPE